MKDFNAWNELKIQLEEKSVPVNFHEREIWLAYCGLNLGYEQDGKHERFLRPVVIIKKFNRDTFWGLPLTHAAKEGPYFVCINFENSVSVVVLSQLKFMDQKRLFRRIGSISDDEFIMLRNCLISLLSFKIESPRGEGILGVPQGDVVPP